MFFVFKQKTAYEMRISDWSSDVCSSDLAQDIALIRTPTGFAFAPIADGAVMEPKAFNALPQEERQRSEGEIEKLQGELQDVVKLIPGWATEHRDALRELNREITAQTLDQPIDRVNARFGTIPGIGSYLEEMREDLLDNVHALLQFETAEVGRAQV